MDWVRDYCVEKLIDTVVRWQVNNPASVLVTPSEILKKRIRSGENMFEVQWSSQDNTNTLPPTFVACVSSTIFSESYPEVFNDHLAKIEAKEASKKKPRKKKDKENVPLKEKKTKSKKEEKNQPKLDIFMKSNAISEIENQVEEKLEKVKVKPKNLVLTKMISEDPQYNKKVIGQKLISPDTSDNVSIESLNQNQNKTDSYVYNPVIKFPAHEAMNCSDSMMLSESMKEYMEDDNDSDLSDIIDQIVGKKKSDSSDKYPIPEFKKSFSTSTPSYKTVYKNFPAQPVVATASPMLRKVHQNLMKEKIKDKAKGSDAFDMSDVSMVLEECEATSSGRRGEETIKIDTICDNNQDEDEEDINFSIEDSFDEFDCMERHTPLVERLFRNKK